MIRRIIQLITGTGFEEFIAKQFILIILIVGLIIIFISNRYECAKKLTRIEALKIEIQELRYENLMLQTEVATGSRQSQVEKELKEKGINLTTSKKRVFEVKK
jgi:cell division protein FtsL